MEKKKGLGKATITSLITGGRRRLLYVYQDKTEMVEEYDMKTHEILSRKWKKPKQFKETTWVYEIGEPVRDTNQQLLIKSNNNPIFIRKDELLHFQWRIRNLFYPPQTYILEVDKQKDQIVVKTTIKKYYKRFEVPDLRRLGIKLISQNLKYEYKNNTLVISYKKPEEILRRELDLRKEFQKLNAKKPKENDIECTFQ